MWLSYALPFIFAASFSTFIAKSGSLSCPFALVFGVTRFYWCMFLILFEIINMSKPCFVKHWASKISVGSSSKFSESKSESSMWLLSSEKSFWWPPTFWIGCCGVRYWVEWFKSFGFKKGLWWAFFFLDWCFRVFLISLTVTCLKLSILTMATSELWSLGSLKATVDCSSLLKPTEGMQSKTCNTK